MSVRTFTWLGILALLWGPSFLLVKIAVDDIPPLTLVATRVGIATMMLYLVLRLRGQRLPAFGRIWQHFAMMGLFSVALPFVSLSWGQQYIDSALAAILVGTTPLFTILLAHLFVADDRVTTAKATGVLLGFGGVLALFIPSFLQSASVTLWGLTAATVAAASYAIGIIYGRQYLRGLPPLVGPTGQLVMATLFTVPLSLAVDRQYTVPSWQAMGALLALAVLATGLAHVIYFRVMEYTSATNLSLITYMVPIVGVLVGVLVLHEELVWNAYLGCVLIIFGIMAVNGVFRATRWPRLAISASGSHR